MHSADDWFAVRAQVREHGVDIAFGAAAGEVVALLGPGGAGKSTALSVVAGEVMPDRGLVRVGDLELLNTEDGREVAAAQRPVSLLAQGAKPFNSLTVAENVAYGARRRGRPAADSAQIARQWLTEFDLATLARKRPRKIGAVAARAVGLAQVFAADAQVLMFDSPFAGLEPHEAASVRASLLRALNAHVAGSDDVLALVAVDDVEDAVMFADRVVAVENGMVADSGPTARVLTRAESLAGAELAGENLLLGTAVRSATGAPQLRLASGAVLPGCSAHDLVDGQDAAALVPVRGLQVERPGQDASGPGLLFGRVSSVSAFGDRIRVRVRHDTTNEVAADLSIGAAGELGLRPEDDVVLWVDAEKVRILPSRMAEAGPQ